MGGADAGVGIFQGEAERCVDAEAADGFEVDVGRGFAVGDLVAGDEDAKIFEEVDLLEALAGDGVAGGGGDAEGHFPDGEIVEQFADAGLGGEAMLRDVVLIDEAAGVVGFFEVEAGAEGGVEEIGAADFAVADHGLEDGIGHVVAGAAGGFLPGDFGDAFGVEHEAVHVEDDAGVGRERSGHGRRVELT